MTKTRLRRKRLAEDDEEDEHRSPSNKRVRAASAALKWLWTPSTPPDPSPQGCLWTYSDTESLFRNQDDLHAPRSSFFSSPPGPALRRTSRRGAISVTSSSPAESDRHLATQLQQQTAIIRLRTAANDDQYDEVERVRRELEDVQIDATLPSILGISSDLERKSSNLGVPAVRQKVRSKKVRSHAPVA